MTGHFYLEYVGDADSEYQRLRLGELPCTVGRGSECEVQLSRNRISRQHARFEATSEGMLLTDLGSTNGTFVNLQRINSPTAVQAGDSIHFANHEFRLVHDASSGHTMSAEAPRQDPAPGHTVAGYTAEPSGFPVQAPQFYELLNEALIGAQVRPVRTAGGRTAGLALLGASTHPRLAADHEQLQALAEALGEEPRLNGMIREFGLNAVEQAGLDESTLFLSIQAGEIEDEDVLIDELRRLAREHRHLKLACSVPLMGIDQSQMSMLHKALSGLGFQLAIRDIDPGDATQLALCRELADYLTIDASHEPETISQVLDTLAGASVQVIVDGVNDSAALAAHRALDGVLLSGSAIGKPKNIG